jgi:D-alanyl-D-alanine carboxypeptidase
MKRANAPVFLGVALAVAVLRLAPLAESPRPEAPGLRSHASSPAQSSSSVLDAALVALDAQLAADFAKDGAGGASIGIVSGNKLIWSRHYGYADAEAKRAPTNDTAYRIGSITKQFTALALMQMVEQGRMKLVEPIEKYVPELKGVQNDFPYAPPITLLQVATMMSGLAREPGCQNHSVGAVSEWQKKVTECLPQTRFQFEPGTQYLYSNIGYATLGLAVERAAGKPFTTVVEEGILEPLRMTRSAFEPTAVVRKDLAHGYTRQGGTPSRTRADAELDGRGYRVPNGALFSTINDLAKFVAWELGEGPDGILKQETQAANYMRTYSAGGGRGALALSSGYGLGFMVSRYDNIVALGHGGSTAGYRASALFHRASKTGVIVLRNAEGGSFDAGPVASRILRQIAAAATATSGGGPSR